MLRLVTALSQGIRTRQGLTAIRQTSNRHEGVTWLETRSFGVMTASNTSSRLYDILKMYRVIRDNFHCVYESESAGTAKTGCSSNVKRYALNKSEIE
jgi:hypothetical protein